MLYQTNLKNRPVKFFKEHVFTQPGCQEWLQKQLSIGKAMNKAPKIWVCTGVQLIADAKVKSGSVGSRSNGGGLALDTGILAGGAPTGTSAANIDAKLAHSNGTTSSYGHADERVWAAQWFQLEVVSLPGQVGTKTSWLNWFAHSESRDGPMDIRLIDLEDLGTSYIREGKFVESHLEAKRQAECGNTPKVIRIVGLDGLEHSDAEQDLLDIEVCEDQYANAVNNIDWKQHEEYSRYYSTLIRDAEDKIFATNLTHLLVACGSILIAGIGARAYLRR
jgi:hypothetical protein